MALGKNIHPGQGETYYRKDDYYLEREGGEEHKLEWGGKLAPELGLSGKASAEDWKNALHGHFPGGIDVKGGTFLDENGNPQRRAGTDFVIEAPKTVSMLYGLTEREDIKSLILSIQDEVEQETLKFFESKIGIRKREGQDENGKEVRNFHTTGEALWGTVRHFVNRDGEAFIHGHGVFLNISKNPDGSYQAMTNDRMIQYQGMGKELGESIWAKRLPEKGFEVAKGKYGEVQLAGFSREQIEFHSNRGQKIEEYIKNKWGVDRKHATQAMKDEAWDMTRKTKTAKDLDGLEKRWKKEAQLCGADEVVKQIEQHFESGKKQKYLSPEKRFEIAMDSLKFAIEHHTEREAAVKEVELLRTALQAGRGKITFKDMERAVEEAKASGELIRQKDDLAGSKQNFLTSRESLEREKRILKYEKSGRHSVEPVMNPLQAENTLKAIEEKEGLTLNEEQKAAARLILTTDNRYIGINGYAGVGKTTMLKPAIESLQNGVAFSSLTQAGYQVIGLGPQHSAVHALKDAGIIQSRTLQSWLSDRKAGQELDSKTVMVIDEAGLANSKDLESAMKRIEKAGARAVLVGDIKQYESVSAGPVFRQLQEKGMETVYVKKMQRQRNAPENIREAANLSIESPEKALEKLDITEIKDPVERYKALAEEYMKSPDKKETLVLTGTHEARKAVNEHVRRTRGMSGKGNEFSRFEANDFTKAQKKKIDYYEVGQNVEFGKRYRSIGVQSGEIGRVEDVDRENGTVRLKMEDGRDVIMTPRNLSGKGHDIGKVEKIELAEGDRIRITGNKLKNEGITNGMKGEVIESKHDSIKVRTDNEKTFDLKPGSRPVEIDHGYAQTGHSAQGLGARTVILDLPSNSRTLNRRSFYTNLTRTKDKVIAFTDDRGKLTGAVTREKDKTMAHDVETQTRERRGKEERKKEKMR